MSNIDWEELRRKVEEDYNNEEANKDSINEHCFNCSECESRKDCIGLPTVSGSDTYDFADEHGLLDDEDNDNEKEDISPMAWRKNTQPVKNGDFLGVEHANMFYPKVNFDYTGMLREVKEDLAKEYDDIQCPHFADASLGIGEVYIYPINNKTRMCLCKGCNANLASKMLEQLALETFI